MSETVRGNKASALRSRIPRYKENRAALWAYTSPVPTSFAQQPAKKQEHKSEAETVSQTRIRSASCTPLTGSTSAQTRPTGSVLTRQTSLQALKAEQRHLEQSQNLFMYKIRTLAEQGQKLPGTFKLVVMTYNDDRELVEESPNDSVGKNKKRLSDELAQRDATIRELKEKLQLSEDKNSQKALQLSQSHKKESTMQSLEAMVSSVMNICDQLCKRFVETDNKLKDVTEQVKRLADSVTDMTELQSQLKTASDVEVRMMKSQLDANQQFLAERSFAITKLQQSELKFKEKYGNIFQEMAQKNTLINLLKNELEAKNEQVKQAVKTSQEYQDSVSKQANTIRLLEEQEARASVMRTKHEERINSMLTEIQQLKQCLSNHAQIMVANIEDMETVRAQYEPPPQPEH